MPTSSDGIILNRELPERRVGITSAPDEPREPELS